LLLSWFSPRCWRRGGADAGALASFARIVGGIEIVKAEQPDRRHLRDGLAGCCVSTIAVMKKITTKISNQPTIAIVSPPDVGPADLWGQPVPGTQR